ncbi:MAG TPA: hypothetical protein VN457_05110 [Chlamydiales bacterium]|nr:hypothetical protein [Chlamydiales bacterium]
MMEFLRKVFVERAAQKLFAIVAAFAIWTYVNSSITVQRVFPKMPVRVVNLPQDKTIRGLMPNGLLDKRLTIQLTGKKELLDELKKEDFEIVLDASEKGDEWIVKLDRRNLVSTNPDIDFLHNVTRVDHAEFIVKLSKLVTDKINLYFRTPKGESPEGYQFIDVFPQRVTHTISGPEEEIRKLQEQGLDVTFDLSLITKEELDEIQGGEMEGADEVSFLVPDSWKKVSIPFLGGLQQEINSPEAKQIRIDFLRKELLPLDRDIPVWVYYPLETIEKLNPISCPLKPSQWVIDRNDLTVIHRPLLAANVSRVFLDVVRDRIELVITADSENKDGKLRWEVDFIDPKQLEEKYVKALLYSAKVNEKSANMPLAAAHSTSYKTHLQLRERFLRSRFREYMQKFQLYDQDGAPLNLEVRQGKDGIVISDG